MVIKLLYIEDNDDNLYTLTLRFETLGGYAVVIAVDAPANVGVSTGSTGVSLSVPQSIGSPHRLAR